MKFIRLIILLTIWARSPLFGEMQQSESAPTEPKARRVAVAEAKAGYFFFSDSTMRKVYDKGGIDVQLSASYPVWRWLQIYGSVEYLTRWGKSIGSHEKTTIWEVPLSLGLKPVWNIHNKIQYYLAIGPRYVFVHAHNHSDFVDRNISQNGIAGFVNTGFNFFPVENCCVDLFAEYFYAKMHFHTSRDNVVGEDPQVGGFTFGLGLGYAF